METRAITSSFMDKTGENLTPEQRRPECRTTATRPVTLAVDEPFE
jgi:hypothetical protein